MHEFLCVYIYQKTSGEDGIRATRKKGIKITRKEGIRVYKGGAKSWGANRRPFLDVLDHTPFYVHAPFVFFYYLFFSPT